MKKDKLSKRERNENNQIMRSVRTTPTSHLKPGHKSHGKHVPPTVAVPKWKG